MGVAFESNISILIIVFVSMLILVGLPYLFVTRSSYGRRIYLLIKANLHAKSREERRKKIKQEVIKKATQERTGKEKTNDLQIETEEDSAYRRAVERAVNDPEEDNE